MSKHDAPAMENPMPDEERLPVEQQQQEEQEQEQQVQQRQQAPAEAEFKEGGYGW